MVNQKTQSSDLTSLVTKAKDILILAPANANNDVLSGVLGLYHVLSGQEKNVFAAIPAKLNQPLPLPGADQITYKIGNRNLVISLKVNSRESIDKVSYNLDEAGKVFNLVIQPKKGHPPLKSQDIEYSYSGVHADLVIILNANRYEDLGYFYQDERKLFTDAPTLAVNRTLASKFALHHYESKEASSLSEVVYKLLADTNLSLNADAATCLLYGIDYITNSLQQPNLDPNTLETFAQLLRAGAKRTPLSQPEATAGRPLSAPPSPFAADPIPQDWLSPKIYSGSPPSRQ